MATTGTTLFPGASTFPNTSGVNPGQGPIPLFRCLYSTDNFSVSTPTWVDASADLRSVSVDRGRNSELENFDAGSASVTLNNRTRTYDPNVNALIRPMNRVWIYAEFSGARIDLFRGYAESWGQDWPDGGFDQVAILHAVDEVKVLNLAILAASGTFSSTTAGPLFTSVLDSVSNHAPRSIMAGSATVAGNITVTLSGQSAFEPLPQIAASDFDSAHQAADGNVFISASGAVTYLDASYRSSAPGNTVQATFGDAGGAELPYKELTIDFSDSFLFNYWTVEGPSGTPQNSSDGTSIGAYGQRANTRSVLYDPSGSGTPGASLAQALVNKYKDPMERETSITPQMADANTCLATLQLDLLERIEVFRTPLGGGARIDQQVFVQGIHLNATPGVPPDVTLAVSPL